MALSTKLFPFNFFVLACVDKGVIVKTERYTLWCITSGNSYYLAMVMMAMICVWRFPIPLWPFNLQGKEPAFFIPRREGVFCLFFFLNLRNDWHQLMMQPVIIMISCEDILLFKIFALACFFLRPSFLVYLLIPMFLMVFVPRCFLKRIFVLFAFFRFL